MSKDYQAKQAALVSEHLKKQDIVITTALIPGRPAPRLVTAAQVASMRAGSVLLDLAVEQGGNVEGAKPDEVVEKGGVRIVGIANLPGRIAADASALYARNLTRFKANPAGARELVGVGEAGLPAKIDMVRLAAMTTVTRALLNLHEVMTRY